MGLVETVRIMWLWRGNPAPPDRLCPGLRVPSSQEKGDPLGGFDALVHACHQRDADSTPARVYTIRVPGNEASRQDRKHRPALQTACKIAVQTEHGPPTQKKGQQERT